MKQAVKTMENFLIDLTAAEAKWKQSHIAWLPKKFGFVSGSKFYFHYLQQNVFSCALHKNFIAFNVVPTPEIQTIADCYVYIKAFCDKTQEMEQEINTKITQGNLTSADLTEYHNKFVDVYGQLHYAINQKVENIK
jgi:hypothetical protein